MKITLPKEYHQINNEIYNTDESGWWSTDSPLHLIKVLLNPVRISYIQRKLLDQFPTGWNGKTALEVGCGGGILCEDIVKSGIDISGIDPSEQSIACAIRHAKKFNLQINYRVAAGESIPYKAEYFDAVFCCDTLEHVSDLSLVISEISRVLKPGGIFIYDTINRTFISYLVAINLLQKWKYWALLPANLHVWNMFIRPKELKTLLYQNKLEMRENRGILPNISPLKILSYLHQRASGKLSYQDFGSKFRFIEGCFLKGSYMGYSIKNL